jgi:hypothetical protein
VLGGHVLRSPGGARRLSSQQPDLGEADLQQPGAASLGSLRQRSSRTPRIVA